MIASSIAKLFAHLMKWLSDRQLIKAGEEKAINESLQNVLKLIEQANDARDAVDHSDSGMRDDKYNRDQ